MSDTPRTDAALKAYSDLSEQLNKNNSGARLQPLSDPVGDCCRELERELAAVRLELAEVWQRRVDDVEEFHQEHLRYEFLRTLNVQQFRAIFARALKQERFDDIIDACIAGCTPECREGQYPGCGVCMMPKNVGQ